MTVITEIVPIESLKPHPRNYRDHPDDQVAHIAHSLRTYGQYRNVVVANDSTLLAGHGVVKAARSIDWTDIEIKRMPFGPDDPRALKLLAGDNELGNLAVVDDRMLTEMLKEIGSTDVDGLLGTGFDDQKLANLLFVTRSAHEIESMDEAEQWVGMPEFTKWDKTPTLLLHTDTEAERDQLVEILGLFALTRGKRVWSARWPPRGDDDASAARFIVPTDEQDAANEAEVDAAEAEAVTDELDQAAADA